MTAGAPNQKLEEAAASAERPDFVRIYEAELSYVWNSLRRLGGQERDLPDLTHDVFMAVHRQLKTYDPARPLKPWLFGICYRVASDFRRRSHHQREVQEDAPEVAAGGADAEASVMAQEARKLVIDALQSLPPDRRAVFVMHELDGHSIPEIADALGVGINTLYSRLRLGRLDFAAAVKRLRLMQGEG